MQNKVFLKYLFTAYLLFLIVFVIIKFDGSIHSLFDRMDFYAERRSLGANNMNLELFHSIKIQLKFSEHDWAIRNLLANTLAFMPFGFLLPAAFPKVDTLFRTFFISLVFICSVECFQYVSLLGSFDVDDIFLNMLGVVVAALIRKIAISFPKGSAF